MRPRFHAPVELQLIVHLVDDDGNHAEATVGFAKGRFFDQERILELYQETIDGLGEESDFRPMTKREWFDAVVGMVRDEDENGDPVLVSAAMPGGDDWDPAEVPAPEVIVDRGEMFPGQPYVDVVRGEVLDQMDRGGSKFPGMSYEDGVLAMIDFLEGNGGNPMDD